jgi:hypothetical protein
MPIVPKFKQADVKARVDKFLEVIVRQQIKRMQMLGEMCVTHARSVPADVGFMDQTGNLRSSEGYMVFLDGVAVHESYDQVQEGAEGVKTGQNLAKKMGAKYKNGVALVVTAGMSYAIHLESKGRDVLTSAELLAKQELPVMVAELKKNINKALSE